MKRRSESEDLRTDLRYLRDTLTSAVTAARTGLLTDVLDTYFELVDEFLSQLIAFGGRYTRSGSFQEIHSIGGGWDEVEWVAKDLRRAIDDSSQLPNEAVARAVLHLPLRVALRAFERRDFYIFRRFVEMVSYGYWAMSKSIHQPIREFAARQSANAVAQSIDYYVSRRIRDAASRDVAQEAAHFGMILLAQFSTLIKESFEQRNRSDFARFAGDLGAVLDFRTPGVAGDAQALRWELENVPFDEEERVSRLTELDRLDAIQEAFADLDRMRHAIFLGIGAWILFTFATDEFSAEETASWLSPLQFPKDLSPLAEIVFGDVQEEIEPELGWTWWELAKKPARTVHTIEFSNYLYLMFLVRVLQTVTSLDPERPPDSLGTKIRYLAGSEDAPLLKLLAEIERDEERWTSIVGPELGNRVQRVRRFLSKAVENARETERQSIRATTIEDDLVSEAARNAERAWESGALMRHLAKRVGAYEILEADSGDAVPFGINTLELKELYITRDDISVLDLGTHYGEALAEGENRRVLHALVKASSSRVQRPIDPTDAVELIRQAVRALRSEESEVVIFTLNSWSASFELEQRGERDQLSSRSALKPDYYFENVPVHSSTFDGDPCVLVLDIRRSGHWEQYLPPRLNSKQYVIGGVATFAVTEFTPAQAQELIRIWRSRGEEPVGGVDELLERVNVRLFERFEYRIDASAAIVRIAVTD